MKINIERYKKLTLTYVQRLNDIRFTGQVLFVVLVLLISWSGVKTIQSNYGLQKQIAALKQQNDVQQLEDDNLALQNTYLNSSQYLELSARENFGLASPGEKEIVVPASVALSYTTNTPAVIVQSATDTTQPKSQRNFQSWINFFLHRSSND
jgi:cell division protein FtsL